MKITVEQAESMIKETFGENAEFPKITIAGAVAWNEEYSIDYSESEWLGREERKIYVNDVETVWEIDMVSGDIYHCGKGLGCFWVHYGNLYEEEEEE